MSRTQPLTPDSDNDARNELTADPPAPDTIRVGTGTTKDEPTWTVGFYDETGYCPDGRTDSAFASPGEPRGQWDFQARDGRTMTVTLHCDDQPGSFYAHEWDFPVRTVLSHHR
jgi:hypothetical protein